MFSIRPRRTRRGTTSHQFQHVYADYTPRRARSKASKLLHSAILLHLRLMNMDINAMTGRTSRQFTHIGRAAEDMSLGRRYSVRGDRSCRVPPV